MKNIICTAIGLAIGVVIGIAASACAFNKKSNEAIDNVEEKYSKKLDELEKALHKATEENEITKEELSTKLSEFEEATINEYCEKVKGYENSDDKENIDVEDDEIDDGSYKPATKPYILEEKDDMYVIDHEHAYEQFTEVLAVYDKARGRVCDEDGCEVLDVNGKLGWNNLNKLYKNATYIRSNIITIIDETDGYIWKVHAGDLYEYMDMDEDSENIDE